MIFKLVMRKMRSVGFKKTAKIIYDELLRPFIPKYYQIRWRRCSRKEGYSGITSVKRLPEIVVSLTTYPARIEGIYNAIETLLMQTLKPDRVILWLAEEQFPNKKLPYNLTKLEKYGLTISWCEDIRSFKKLIPTLREYPEAIIITTDDDMYYHPKMVERLYKAYLKEPQYIHCHRVSKIVIENGVYKAIPGGYDIFPHPTFLHKLTGGSGACYPPHSLYKDIMNSDIFMKLAPTNDDIWFWFMAILEGRRCNVIKHSCTALYFVKESQETSLHSLNDNGEKLFWKQFNKLICFYPQIDEVLRKEWEREKFFKGVRNEL